MAVDMNREQGIWTDEEQRVRLWRFDQLVRGGFAPADAAAIADDPAIELAQARRLVALGCPAETAARILL